jgi:hypothetical protein
MNVTYGKGFAVAEPKTMREKVQALQGEMLKLPQYEPETKHYFHAGMYCREVFRHAGVLIVGRVHTKEHFYLIANGTVTVTTDDGVQTFTGPHIIQSKPGAKRAVYAETDATCMTFHVTECKTPEEAEIEMVEPEDLRLFDAHNKLNEIEVTL